MSATAAAGQPRETIVELAGEAAVPDVAAKPIGKAMRGAGPGAGVRDPSSMVLQNASSCVLRWSALGVRAQVTNLGQAFSPCLRGIFSQARLTPRSANRR